MWSNIADGLHIPDIALYRWTDGQTDRRRRSDPYTSPILCKGDTKIILRQINDKNIYNWSYLLNSCLNDILKVCKTTTCIYNFLGGFKRNYVFITMLNEFKTLTYLPNNFKTSRVTRKNSGYYNYICCGYYKIKISLIHSFDRFLNVFIVLYNNYCEIKML
jgi:hypothetical protein